MVMVLAPDKRAKQSAAARAHHDDDHHAPEAAPAAVTTSPFASVPTTPTPVATIEDEAPPEEVGVAPEGAAGSGDEAVPEGN
jgi:hypothetical protein